jgi:hypothetical protein
VRGEGRGHGILIAEGTPLDIGFSLIHHPSSITPHPSHIDMLVLLSI